MVTQRTSESSCTHTVLVLGGAYGGARAAQVLANDLPSHWRVILVDRNSHVNHVYTLPRLTVLPGHEHKAFVPYTHIFNSASLIPSPAGPASTLFLHATVTDLSTTSVKLSRPFPEHGFPDGVIPYDYIVYALGSGLPDPVNLWEKPPACEEKVEDVMDVYQGRKTQSIGWLKKMQHRIQQAQTVLVVGGGALGIQFATDIAEIYTDKKVTLLHSRHTVMNRFDETVHAEVLQSLEALDVTTILGDRLATFPSSDWKGTVRTTSGREITADLILMCTGQTPNTALLSLLDSRVVNPQSRLARVKRTMQLAVPSRDDSSFASASTSSTSTGEDKESTIYDHMFVIGDAADAFGALKAGHNAYYQGDLAARNIIKLVRLQTRLERAAAGPVEDGVDIEVEACSDYDDDVVDSIEYEEDDGYGTTLSELSSSSSSSSWSVSDDELDVVSLPNPDALEEYIPGPPAIKVTLGVKRSVYQINGVVGIKDDGMEDCGASAIWPFFGFKVESEEQLFL